MALHLLVFMVLATSLTVEGRTDPKARCWEPKDSGPGFAHFVRYYFNQTTNSCEKFVYGGMKGNGNNFQSKGECELICLDKVVEPPIDPCVTRPPTNPICRLPKCVGTGNGNVPRYYFNPVTGNCEVFCYGGCNGNSNNFQSKAQCELTCLGCVKAVHILGHTSIACHHKNKRSGSTKEPQICDDQRL